MFEMLLLAPNHIIEYFHPCAMSAFRTRSNRNSFWPGPCGARKFWGLGGLHNVEVLAHAHGRRRVVVGQRRPKTPIRVLQIRVHGRILAKVEAYAGFALSYLENTFEEFVRKEICVAIITRTIR